MLLIVLHLLEVVSIAVIMCGRQNIVSSFASSFSDKLSLIFFGHTGYVTLLRY